MGIPTRVRASDDWYYHCQDASSSAAEAFATAHTALPVLVAPAPGDTTLLLAELGRGPVKERDGTQAQKLVFKPGPGDGVSGASFDLAGQSAVPGVEAANITFQATTRGGRAIDGIQDGKASFKETTGAIGQVATQTSLMNLAGGDTSGSNMGMAVAGMLFSMFSSAAKTQADIRGWDNLPDRIVLASAKTDSTSAPIKIRFTTSTAPSSAEAAPLMNGSAGKCAIAWSRSTTSAGLSPATPGEDAGVAAAVARKSAVQAKDKAFRIALSGAGGAKQLASGGGS